MAAANSPSVFNLISFTLLSALRLLSSYFSFKRHGFHPMIEARAQNRPRSAKPLAPPPCRSEIDILAVLQEGIGESAEKRNRSKPPPHRVWHRPPPAPARPSIRFGIGL